MAYNLADNLSPAAWIAPLTAPIGAIPMFVHFDSDTRLINSLDFAGWVIFVSYMYMVVLVIPILWATRNQIIWTAPRLIVFGGVLGISPLIVAFAWELLDQALNGQVRQFAGELLRRDWTLFWTMLSCGLVVSSAFVIVRILTRKGAT